MSSNWSGSLTDYGHRTRYISTSTDPIGISLSTELVANSASTESVVDSPQLQVVDDDGDSLSDHGNALDSLP